MFKKIVKGLTLFAAVIAVTFVSSSVVKADIVNPCNNPSCPGFHPVDAWEYVGDAKCAEKCTCGGHVSTAYDCVYNGTGACIRCGQAHENHNLGPWKVYIDYPINDNHGAFDSMHGRFCSTCGYTLLEDHSAANSNPWIVADSKTWSYQVCGIHGCTLRSSRNYVEPTKEEKKEEKKEESKHEEPARNLAKEAFGGRAPEALSVEEQKTAVSYALANLRAGGLALPVNTVKASGTNNGSSDIAAVVADNRDAINQQVFAQVMCQNLGFKNITPLKTYNMYALHATYDAKTKAQTITWANTGLKFGDTAFVVWYNQKLGKIELLPAVVGPNGDVAVSVPALGDVSTMTVVKAN